jgi:galactokinase
MTPTGIPAHVAAEARRALDAGRIAFGTTWQPTAGAYAPGRIEIIGNHLDYNGGEVIAGAIDRFLVVLTEHASEPGSIVATFADDPDADGAYRIDASLDWRNDGAPDAAGAYLRGAIAALQARDAIDVTMGRRIAVAGSVPLGLGVSSSAAFCVALCLALASREFDPSELVLTAQEAEHRAGSPCGTMDQSASVGGNVIRFTGPAAWDPFIADLGDHLFVVVDSGVSRSLGASSYPVRVRECRAAAAAAPAVLGRDVASLADITPDELATLEQAPQETFDRVWTRRARHVVTEQARVLESVDVLQEGDWDRFGAIMTASGASSAGDYEISHPRVEDLVAECNAAPGVLGARMMGGGEGGAVLALLRKAALAPLRAALAGGYAARYGLEPERMVHPCAFAPGADRFTID